MWIGKLPFIHVSKAGLMVNEGLVAELVIEASLAISSLALRGLPFILLHRH